VQHLPAVQWPLGMYGESRVLWLKVLQAALSLAANVLFTYQARRAAAAEARQASAQPMLRPQVLASNHTLHTLDPTTCRLLCCFHN
jgi:hypothetical protein